MKTELLKQNPTRAAEIICAGGLVGVPTETVYGLAGNGLNPQAVEAIYEVKGRPSVKPLSLMVPGKEAMEQYCVDVPEAAYILADAFWPGPLTLILKARTDLIPDIVRAGNATIGLRCPDHADTLALLREAGVPLAAPSANPSGAPSPKTADDVMNYFDGSIAAVIDGGPCGLGFESTILDLTRTPYRILRQGALPADSIRACLRDSLKIIGITGGTGCGKTTALNVLRDEGFLVIDTDEVYHELLEHSDLMLNELKEAFPGAFATGSFDRKALGSIVFADPDQLNLLNGITHRHVNTAVNERLADWAMEGGKYAALDAIALFESGENEICAATVGIVADDETRVKRIMARDGISGEYARSRVAAQHSADWFQEHCTVTIANNGTEAEFEAACRREFKEIEKQWMTN